MDKQTLHHPSSEMVSLLCGLVDKHDSFVKAVCGDTMTQLEECSTCIGAEDDQLHRNLKNNVTKFISRIEENTKSFTDAFAHVLGASCLYRLTSNCSIGSDIKVTTLNQPFKPQTSLEVNDPLSNAVKENSVTETKNTLARLSTNSNIGEGQTSQLRKEAFSATLKRLSDKVHMIARLGAERDHTSIKDKLKTVENKICSIVDSRHEKSNALINQLAKKVG